LLKNTVECEPITETKNGVEKKIYRTATIRCKGKSVAGKPRRFVFSEATMDALLKWVQERGEDDCPFMFITRINGIVKQVGDTVFNTWCADDFSKIVGRRVHPHALRYSRATTLSNSGVELEKIRLLLGHESVATSKIYVVSNTDEDDIKDLLL
jgi:site-specific recombinase XerD